MAIPVLAAALGLGSKLLGLNYKGKVPRKKLACQPLCIRSENRYGANASFTSNSPLNGLRTPHGQRLVGYCPNTLAVVERMFNNVL